MRIKLLVRKLRGIENKVDTVIDSNKQQPSYRIQIGLPIIILIIGVIANLITGYIITKKSENQLAEFINNQTTKEIDTINSISQKANYDIKNQIESSTKESIKKIQDSVYPNDFKVALICYDDVTIHTEFKDPSCNMRDIQKKQRGESVKVDLNVSKIKVTKDKFRIAFEILNNCNFISLDTLISFYFEMNVTDFEDAINMYKKEGYVTFSSITPFTTLGDNVNNFNPLNLHGFSLVAHPFEAGNKIIFNFDIILQKDQTFLGVKVRNNFFLFKLEKDTI